MREIDPIREPSEALLSSALHRLASAGERNAPVEVERALLERFRQHHRRRRDLRLITVTAIAACLIVAGLLLKTQPAANVHNAAKAVPPQQGKTTPAESVRSNALAHRPPQAAVAQPPAVVAEGGFVPLPSYDPATASGELQLVRVELPESDLRMLGAPVAGNLSDEPVTVDFITDRDGTPYAVRLVQ
ncbi:MAG TPA: hypothetical protein VFP59_13090 [Candidatus Angelobacter sp.]|nr:hypothetical protein [Candidatus Angelobacter sp.]